MKPVFAYLRVSGRGQIEGDGFDRQQAAIEQYCAAKGYQVIRWFREEGVSGTTDALERPRFGEMLALCGPATTSIIIVERADRFARDLMVQELAIQEAGKAGVTILEAASDTNLTDSSDPTRVAIRQMLGVLAQWNKSVTVLRLRAARNRKRSRGERVEGPKPFETKSPENLEAAKIIVTLRESNHSYRDIAALLREKRISPPGGRKWWFPATVRDIYLRHRITHHKNLEAVLRQPISLDGLPVG